MLGTPAPTSDGSVCHFGVAASAARGGLKARYELLQSKPPQPNPFNLNSFLNALWDVFLLLGKIWERNHFFLANFRPVRSEHLA
jgi:hypothetical protein